MLRVGIRKGDRAVGGFKDNRAGLAVDGRNDAGDNLIDLPAKREILNIDAHRQPEETRRTRIPAYRFRSTAGLGPSRLVPS